MLFDLRYDPVTYIGFDGYNLKKCISKPGHKITRLHGKTGHAGAIFRDIIYLGRKYRTNSGSLVDKRVLNDNGSILYQIKNYQDSP